jgi:hypothetical protein
VRRRRLRQDRSRDARRVQGGDGRQAGRVLAPTTVLAFQHRRRCASASPASRSRSTWSAASAPRQEQKETLADLAAGKVDIIVGTHRLLSKDVQFRDLGLLVVDEEQRFGVAHKERIKQMRKKVDVLTMSATPIPRTLNMSLVGIRDMSIIETPPKDRLSIQTNVVKFDRGDRARSQRAGARRPGLTSSTTASSRSSRSATCCSGSCPRRGSSSATARWRGRARARDARLRRAQVRRAAGDDDRRERPRHPERQHDHHQPRRSLRPVAALSAARPRRPIRSPAYATC